MLLIHSVAAGMVAALCCNNHLERLQLSFRREDGVVIPAGRYGVEVEWVTLEFGR